MNKLLKHEFRATARMIVPFLAISAVSAVFFEVFWSNDVPPFLQTLVTFVLSTAVMALFFIGLIIIVSRFYRNVMTDTGYLTMTLPLNAHELVWGELIMCLLWFIITAVVLFSAFLGIMLGMNFIELPGKELIKETWDAIFKESNAFLIIVEGIVTVILGLFLFCLRVYNAMAIGQLFSRKRGLLSFVAYFLLGMMLAVLFTAAMNIFGSAMRFESMSEVSGSLAIFDLILLLLDAVMYISTTLLIGKRLNLT